MGTISSCTFLILLPLLFDEITFASGDIMTAAAKNWRGHDIAAAVVEAGGIADSPPSSLLPIGCFGVSGCCVTSAFSSTPMLLFTLRWSDFIPPSLLLVSSSSFTFLFFNLSSAGDSASPTVKGRFFFTVVDFVKSLFSSPPFESDDVSITGAAPPAEEDDEVVLDEKYDVNCFIFTSMNLPFIFAGGCAACFDGCGGFGFADSSCSFFFF
mmetsp:Transcript_22605/g.38670  ORF Transcript_22605/g.38670 Transcript_22605/m.38670 type:complete len:211 (-) Transcript_22605:42-674(-)